MVVLPAPLGPIMQNTLPRSTSKLTSSTAITLPYSFRSDTICRSIWSFHPHVFHAQEFLITHGSCSWRYGRIFQNWTNWDRRNPVLQSPLVSQSKGPLEHYYCHDI